jgi:ABC-2 type transport system ATP-binding protein
MRSSGSLAIEVRGLAKRFGDVQAVQGVSFSVYDGEIFGFLGPNGAGKTTTINVLTGLARPDAGTIHVAGIECSKDPKAAQHLMGIVPDESNLYPELTGLQNLAFCGALYGMTRRDRERRARQLLEMFGLTEAAARRFAGYSKGMKRKLTIAAGIIHGPTLLFLDEPTTGIDVASARQIRQLILDLNRAGTTIFLTTHYIEEAERLCKRIAFIVEGRIVRIDTIDDLLQQAQERRVVEFVLDGSAAGVEERLQLAFPSLACEAAGRNAVRVRAGEPIRIGPLVRFFEEQGLEVGEARKIRPSLEEVFVQVTGVQAAAMKAEKEKARTGASA